MMPQPKRRDVLRLGTALGALTALGGLPRFAPAAAAATVRPAALSLVPASAATTLWYQSPGSESNVMQQGLPIGNGRLGAMATGDPAADAYFLTDVSLWTGGANVALGSDGQFPYDNGGNFGSFQTLAKAHVNVPAHSTSAVSGYRRMLDLSNGYVSATYQYGGVTYTREAYASHPDDVVVVRLKQSGGGSYTGNVALSGTHGETTQANSGTMTASFAGTMGNGLAYACVAAVAATGGTLSVSGAQVAFAGCSEVVIVFCGGTNYTPNSAVGYKDTSVNPLSIALNKARAAAAVPGDTLLATHVADYQALYNALTVNLGSSTAAQRAMDTPSRLAARAASGAAPDPELEAGYLQFGRYLAITGSRGTLLPANLQGLWLDNNNPAWHSDYHTDINLQMNYWLADRSALASCFEIFADYCLAQLPGWSAMTQSLFQDPRNGFRNSSGRVAGWTTAISANVWGGGGWWWHPASSAWITNTLYDHYLYTLDSAYLQKIYPLLKGACQFWEARLITDPATGLLIDDSDWSPEQGPTNAKGITYAQELVWQLFANYAAAAAALGQDSAYAATISALQAKLYLPQVSSTTGWLEEWMTPSNLGETTHRHLSPLIGLFPGDRITADRSPAALLAGVTNLLTARGMSTYGWGMAWRAACWARLKNSAKAYQAVMTVLQPSVNYSNGAAINLLDMYNLSSNSSVFQIDANFGTPSAMLEMLVYSRPGLIELLPATPSAWLASGSVTGVASRGAFTVDMVWTGGRVTSATIHGKPGASTTVKAGTWSQAVTIGAGGSTTVTPNTTVSTTFKLVNRHSGKALDDPGASRSAGTALIQWTVNDGANQHWTFTPAAGGAFTVTNVSSGLLIDVNGGSTADDATIIQWSADGGANQLWTLVDAGGGFSKLVSAHSGKVIAVRGDSTADNAAIVQQTDTGDISQHWQMIAV